MQETEYVVAIGGRKYHIKELGDEVDVNPGGCDCEPSGGRGCSDVQAPPPPLEAMSPEEQVQLHNEFVGAAARTAHTVTLELPEDLWSKINKLADFALEGEDLEPGQLAAYITNTIIMGTDMLLDGLRDLACPK